MEIRLEILVASESDVRHWQPSVLVFHEAKILEACKLEIEAIEILVASESDVRHWQPSVLVLHGVSVLRGQGLGGLQPGIWSYRF